jgi:hypothetical protein
LCWFAAGWHQQIPHPQQQPAQQTGEAALEPEQIQKIAAEAAVLQEIAQLETSSVAGS